MISARVTYQVTTEIGVTGKYLDVVMDANDMIEIKTYHSYSKDEFDNVIRQLVEVSKLINE